MEEPEAQDFLLQAVQTSDATVPPLQSREQQKDLETQTEFTVPESQWPLQACPSLLRGKRSDSNALESRAAASPCEGT